MPNNEYAEFEAALQEARADWKRRLDSIRVDRRRENAPLDPDFEEQATQRENDDVLDALDQQGHREIEAIQSALDRIAKGVFGVCLECGESISTERLRASPAAGQCIGCAQVGSPA